MFIVAQRFALWCLVFLPKMSAARFISMQRIDAHQLRELEEIRNTPRSFEALVQICFAAGNIHVLPELPAHFPNASNGVLQARGCPRHAAVFPHDLAELAVERIDSPLPVNRE